eukprot:6512561-Lingulodinium_polyedra.AAC.1
MQSSRPFVPQRFASRASARARASFRACVWGARACDLRVVASADGSLRSAYKTLRNDAVESAVRCRR